MTENWSAADPGILRFPSGVLVRGRGLRAAKPPEGPDPSFGMYLLGGPPPDTAWESRWVRWPDFGLPADPGTAGEAFREALSRAARERVEVACDGGMGRTGTALACMAVLDGVPADEAVAFVRRHYHPQAVETPWQRRWVRRFTAG